MKILLINHRILKREYSPTPVSLLSIAAVLRKEGLDFSFIDLNFEEDSFLENALRKESPSIVCMSPPTETRFSVFNICRKIKEYNPHILIILGGHHVSYLYNQVLENYEVDVCVIGEGDETIINLLRKIKLNKPWGDVKGIAFKKKGKIIKTEKRGPVKNLDDLPLLPYDLIKKDYLQNYMPYTPISRGCFGNCSFCPNFGKNCFRHLNVKNTVNSIAECATFFKKGEIAIGASTFPMEPKFLKELYHKLKKNGVEREFCTQTDYWTIHKESLKLMEKMGFRRLLLGIESGSQKVLDINTPTKNVRTSIQAIRKTNDAGIKSIISIILGLPGENKNTLNETFRFVRKVKFGGLCTNACLIFPGTRVYQYALQKEVITDKEWLKPQPYFYYTENFSFKQLQYYRLKLALSWALKNSSFDELLKEHGRMVFNSISIRLTCKQDHDKNEIKNSFIETKN